MGLEAMNKMEWAVYKAPGFSQGYAASKQVRDGTAVLYTMSPLLLFNFAFLKSECIQLGHVNVFFDRDCLIGLGS